MMSLVLDLGFSVKATDIVLWYPEVFSLMNEHVAKRRNTREPLGAHVRSFERADPIRSRY